MKHKHDQTLYDVLYLATCQHEVLLSYSTLFFTPRPSHDMQLQILHLCSELELPFFEKFHWNFQVLERYFFYFPLKFKITYFM